MRKILLTISLCLFSLTTFSQCTGTQTFTLSPSPVAGGYAPGTVVSVCYTMTGYTMTSSNWAEGFVITLGPGWTGLSATSTPANCGGATSGGDWIWMNSVTSSATGLTVGPGFFFDLTLDGNAGNDFGDMGNCTWSFCFNVTVVNSCTPQNLLITVTAGGDGNYGSWSSPACALVPFTIFNGSSTSGPLPSLGLISHN